MDYRMDSSDTLVGNGCIISCIVLTPTPVDDEWISQEFIKFLIGLHLMSVKEKTKKKPKYY